MADIKLFVCCHQPNRVPEHPILVPVQVGSALSDTRFEGFLHDDMGENISEKNHSYCELTAQYWAWKNVEADYYGLFHYRRYLFPDLSADLPYQIEDSPTEEILQRLDYDSMSALIRQYDLIVPLGENMFVSVREHYANAPFHYKKDLDLIEQIIWERYPEYVTAMDTYFSGTVCYFGNICIMKRQIFHDYCAWLFSVLEEFDRRADLSGYSPQELRVNGYLAERLLGVYITMLRKEGNCSVLELPRVHFMGERCFRQRIINLLFPPGSRRRSLIKTYIHKRGARP